MKEISTISPERMNNGAHFLYMSNILARAEADAKVKAGAAEQVAALKAAVAQEDEDLRISQKSLLTDDISRADADRDALYAGYRKSVAGFLNLPDEAMMRAARTLHQHIRDYAIEPRMQLDTETGLLMNFIADLEGKYRPEVESLALTPFVTGMKEANDRVRTLTASRTDAKADTVVGALKASRKKSDEAYRMLVKMVNALALVNGEADYAPFIAYVNTEITHYKQEVLARRAAPSGSGSAPDDTPNDAPDGTEPDDTPETAEP